MCIILVLIRVVTPAKLRAEGMTHGKNGRRQDQSIPVGMPQKKIKKFVIHMDLKNMLG